MTVSTEISGLKEKIQKVVQFTVGEFATIHTGKASTTMVENVMVEAYGSKMRLKDMAAISTPDPRTISITPWDKGTFKAIEKGLLVANLGFTPVVDADRVRCMIPEMSRERRTEMVKMAGTIAETGRVSVRNLRRDTNNLLRQMEKDGEISEDELKRADKDVQKIIDQAIEEIGKLLTNKEKELLSQ